MTLKVNINTEKDLQKENEELRQRLNEAEETLMLIRSGEVDAIVVSRDGVEKIFTLESAETPYRLIVEQMNEGALTISKEGVILFCNQRLMDIFSLPSEKILGSYFSQLIVEDDKKKFNTLLENGLLQKSAGEIRCLTKRNQVIHLNLLLNPILKEMVGDICIVASDISALKLKEYELSTYNDVLTVKVNERTASLQNTLDELETTLEELKISNEELGVANDKARESDRLKTAFLGNMSHEIRTPMNAILGFTELLKNPNLPVENQQKFINLIEKGGKRLLNIINDLIDISKIESGQTKVIVSSCNIKEQVEYVYHLFKPEVTKKGLRISIQSGMSEDETIILSDREKIYAILTNLVKNAIKYTDKGLIEVGYHLSYHSVPPKLKFFVKDTGIGVPNDKLDSIFNRFEQVESALIRRSEGVGLGLSIVKGYIALLGGKIWVESHVGSGSTFHFTIPYNKVEINGVTPNDVISADELKEKLDKKLKILIVEDDESSAILQKEMVKNHSKEILHVDNGIDAVETFRKNPDIDLILMDISLPMMSGDEATKKIREIDKEVIIIAQSAHVFDYDRDKALNAGCNEFITKPLNRSLLQKLMVKYF